MPVIGRFSRIDKARKKRRVTRVPVNVNKDTVEALNKAVENAVRASLVGGITTLRKGVAKMQLDTAFNAQDYTKLRKTTAWQKAEASLTKAAKHLSGIVPDSVAHTVGRTAEDVRRGVVAGVGGAAAQDTDYTQPIDFDAAFGRKSRGPKVPKATADPLSRRVDASNPRLAPHTLKRRDKYLQDLILPQREDIMRIASDRTRSMRERQGDIKDVLRPVPDEDISDAVAVRIGLNRMQVRALDKAEAADRDAGLSDTQVDRNQRARSDKMLEQRCATIATTESRAASGSAQVEAWLALQDQGLIGPNAMKVWHLAWEQACPEVCRPVDGVMVALADDFILGNGKPCFAPGQAHPNCRCLCSLYDPDVDDDVTVDGRIARNPRAFPQADEPEGDEEGA